MMLDALYSLNCCVYLRYGWLRSRELRAVYLWGRAICLVQAEEDSIKVRMQPSIDSLSGNWWPISNSKFEAYSDSRSTRKMKLQIAILLLSTLAFVCVEMAAPKRDWSKLIGKTGDQAMKQILKERPDFKVFIVPEGGIVTMDYRVDRVRIYVNSEGKVISEPRIG